MSGLEVKMRGWVWLAWLLFTRRLPLQSWPSSNLSETHQSTLLPYSAANDLDIFFQGLSCNSD
jgi:hypothetical protein